MAKRSVRQQGLLAAGLDGGGAKLHAVADGVDDAGGELAPVALDGGRNDVADGLGEMGELIDH